MCFSSLKAKMITAILPFSIDHSFLEKLCRIPTDHTPRFYITKNGGSCPYNSTFTNYHPGTNERFCGYPSIFSYSNRVSNLLVRF